VSVAVVMTVAVRLLVGRLIDEGAVSVADS
jgi:hypothetical protein